MKKLLILPVVLGLAACDRPISETDLVCNAWNSDTRTEAEYNLAVRVYDNYALMSIDGGAYKNLPLVEESKYTSMVMLEFYDGQYGLGVHINRKGAFVSDFSLTHPAYQKNYGISCDAKVPFNSKKYPAPTAEEECVKFITNTVYLKDEKDLSAGLAIAVSVNEYPSRAEQSSVRFYEEYVDIPADDAKYLSPNWDYSNMKLYDERDGIQEHEMDACGVRMRLQRYMATKGLDKLKKVYKDELKAEPKVVELKCASSDIYKPYNDVIMQIEEGRIHFTDKAKKEWGMSFYLDENTNYSDKESGISVWLDNGYLDHAEVANGACDVVVPMGTQFNADCQGTKLSGQINKDHAIVSIDGGDEVRLPLSAKNADETVNIDGYIFKESENGWALSVAADTGADKVFQIGISEPNGQSVYKGCTIKVPLK